MTFFTGSETPRVGQTVLAILALVTALILIIYFVVSLIWIKFENRGLRCFGAQSLPNCNRHRDMISIFKHILLAS
jgi:hypothetical protein